MHFFVLISLLFLSASASPGVAQETGPSKARVARTVRELKKALKHASEEEQVNALQNARDVPHPDLAKVVAQALAHDTRAVRVAAIQGLRWMEHPTALEPLLATFGKNKKLRRDEAERLTLLKAIGQHGDRRSIGLLAGNAFRSKNRDLTKACLFGLGMIREKEALEAFMKMIQGTQPKRLKRHTNSIRLALMMLTGVDQGPSPARWLTWWNKAKQGFEMPPTPPRLPREDTLRWNAYWGTKHKDHRPQRREDRGGPPDPTHAKRRNRPALPVSRPLEILSEHRRPGRPDDALHSMPALENITESTNSPAFQSTDLKRMASSRHHLGLSTGS